MNMQPIRVLLVDDHRHIHQIVMILLSAVADIELVGQASNGHEALLLCLEHQPDIVLMDIMMPVMDGLETTQRLHQQFSDIKILVLSNFYDDEIVRDLLKEGAVGYILKTALARDLVNTIRIIYLGSTVLSGEIAQLVLHPTELKPQRDFGLTQRELEVLKLVAEGLNNGEIAQKLIISPSTVKFHITNLCQKMQVQTRVEAIVLAARNNLV
ncbi:MAG: response regulator transcription factor [Chloroflexota bacterium]